MAEAKVEKEVVTPGKVTEVCRQFLASADAGLAQRLQSEEYDIKYQWNRDSRKVARVDVPLAKTVHDLEEERLQKERFEFLLQQKKLAEEDERMAHQLQKEEQQYSERDKELLAQKDAEIALQMQREEEQKKKQAANVISQKDAEVALQLQREEEQKKKQAANVMEYDDAKIALEMQKEEILGKDRNRMKIELEDEALAQQFQEQERQLSEMKTVERQLREQRHQLELELQLGSQTDEMSRLGRRTENVSISERTSRPTANRDTVAMLRGRNVQGYRISDVDFFMSDEDKRKLVQMQDEELAKALQEHEEKKARRTEREIAAEIEQHDAQLARIMQKVERLEALKRQQHHQQTDAYIILPVPHVESTPRPVASGVRSNSSSSARNIVESGEYSQLFVPDNDLGSGRASGVVPDQNGPPIYSLVDRSRSNSSSESMRQLSSTGASPPNSPLSAPNTPAPPPPPPPASDIHRPHYASVTHTRVTETRVTSQPRLGNSVVSRDGSRQRPNNENVSSTMPAHYQQNNGASSMKRRSSKDKSCKQQ